MTRTRLLQLVTFALLTTLTVFGGVGSRAHAATVTGLSATTHDGQTFVTWNGLPGRGWRYRIYSGEMPLLSSLSLASATLEGTVGDSSAWDRRITNLIGAPLGFRTDSAAAPLAPDAGLFVVDIAAPANHWYAVTAESSSGVEDRTIDYAHNSLATALSETPAPSRPVYQRTFGSPVGEDWVLWGGPRATSDTPALWPTPSTAFHVGLLRGQPSGPLEFNGHGRGGSFLNALFGAGLGGETVIAPDDHLDNIDQGTWYLGFHQNYQPGTDANTVPTSGAIVPYSEARMLRLLDWAQAKFRTDPARTYAMGSSMGGTFACFFALHHPDRIAAAFAFVPKLDFDYTPAASPTMRASLDRLFGSVSTDPPVANAQPVGAWLDATQQFGPDANGNISPILAFMGRNDIVVGWPEKLAVLAATRTKRTGGWWYWDSRTHDTSRTAPLSPMQDAKELGKFRLDRSWPAIAFSELDGTPGDGSASSGDTLGTYGGYCTFDTTISDNSSYWAITLRLRPLRTRAGDRNPPDSALAEVTPRRVQHFPIIAGVRYAWHVVRLPDHTEAQSGVATAGAGGTLTIPGVRLFRNGGILTIAPLDYLAAPEAGPVRTIGLRALAAAPGAIALALRWPGGTGELALYDLAGRRLVREPITGAAGERRLELDRGELPAGVYLAAARRGGERAVVRVVLLR